MNIRVAEKKDYEFLSEYDKHISRKELQSVISLGRVLMAEKEGVIIGWLRWNLFWDNTPFMNMLFFLDGYRGQGYGKVLVSSWERQMKEAGYQLVMTSTLSSEEAQHFYRSMQYVDSGALLLPDEPLELIFTKVV